MNRKEKQRELDRLNEVVTSPLTVGGSETGLNLCDMYTQLHDRDQVLTTLQERYPHELGDYGRFDAQHWLEKITALHHPQSYISAYVGEVGELRAMEALRKLGVTAEQFTSRTHEANDLITPDGVAYSVKSYDPQQMHTFLNLAHHTPDSTNYVVNEELYHRLQESGHLASLQDSGIEVIDGGFSHDDADNQADDVLDRVASGHDVHVDVLAHVPVVAGIAALASIGLTTYKYHKGTCSNHELAVDIAGALTRIAAGSGGMVSGSLAGAAIGSAVFPILGTLIGGTVGGLLGSMGARQAVRAGVAYAKWGSVLSTFESLGRKFSDGLPARCVAAIANSILRKPDIECFLSDEKARTNRFDRELNPGDPTPPTIAAVLWWRATERAERTLAKIAEAAVKTPDSLVEVCIDAAIARYPRQRKSALEAAYTMWGSFIVEVPLLRNGLAQEEQVELDPALTQLTQNPNHPFRTEQSKSDILAAVSLKTLAEVGANP